MKSLSCGCIGERPTLVMSEQAVVAGIGDPGCALSYSASDSSALNGQSIRLLDQSARTGSLHIFPFLAASSRSSAETRSEILPARLFRSFQAGITDLRYGKLAHRSFTAPLLPLLHEDWQRFGISSARQKKCHDLGMIRSAQSPTHGAMRITPFQRVSP